MRCRRAWDFTSSNRQNLRQVGAPPTALHIGSAVHKAFDAQAEGHDPMEAADEYMREQEEKFKKAYKAQVGVAWGQDEQLRLDESRRFVRVLVKNYFDHY